MQSQHSQRYQEAIRTRSFIESLEPRVLLAAIMVNPTQSLRAIDARMTGANLAWWQWEMNTTTMRNMITSAGLKLFRLPGGSSSDDNLHFNNPPPYNGYQTAPIIANVIQAVGGDAMITVNYGTGSPQEGAAWLSYYNAPVGSNVAIGTGPQWDANTNSWVQKNWQTSGYWAGLRAAAPLAVDDGLNFLRVNHPAPWAFGYYEIGNEEYATWEVDKHTLPHDPATYITFAKSFAVLAQQIDPNVKVGIDVSMPLQWNMPDLQWTHHLLQQSAAQGFVPGFLSDHVYITGLSDQNLLLHSVNDPNYKTDLNYNGSWAGRASFYRNLLTQDLGASGAGVQLMLTEFNSDINTKQAINLVGGLWAADALGGLAQTEYTAAIPWDLTNGYTPLGAPDNTRYGWRQGVDMGLISTGSGPAPASGAFVPYPIYFAEQLWAKLAQPGASVINVSSNDPKLSSYAVRLANGHLRLLVVNKDSASTIPGTFNINGFIPTTAAQMWQYGKAEDTAQSQTSNGSASLTGSNPILNLSGASFTLNFPSYSMSVIDLTPAALKAIASDFPYQTSGNKITFTFDQPVDASSLTPGDLSLTLAGGTAPGVLSVSLDASATTATFTLASPVPDGNYTAALAAGSLRSIYLAATSSPASLPFFSLVGDANRDKTVDSVDFNVLAANFGQSGRNFGQGNFNYDPSGSVDTVDFNLLAGNFGEVLAGDASRAAAATLAAPPLGRSTVLTKSAPIVRHDSTAATLFGDQAISLLV